MSPAQKHRERHALAARTGPTTAIVSGDGGGRPAPVITPLTPARRHAIASAVASASAATAAPDAATPTGERVDPVAAQIQLRLAHDLRRLKEIASIERRIDAKREMLPEYRPWCEALIAAGADADPGIAHEVLPTMMVWAIDVGDWPLALRLAGHVVGNDVALPARYKRSAPALIVEEVATAALKAQASGERFPINVLAWTDALTSGADMHDEIRAKLMKAVGTERAALADAIEDKASADFVAAAEVAVETLKRAQQLNERAGVKTLITRFEKAIAAANDQAGTAG